MLKIDFKKDLKHLYNPPANRFALVAVPPMQFLMIDGAGDPNTAPAYTQAVEALYAVAYKLKFLSKAQLNQDYTVPPLEGLWWAADMDSFTTRLDKDAWQWTMMIMTPDWISANLYAQAVAAARQAKELPALSGLRLEPYAEGLSVQILHRGSYDAEGPTLHRLHHEFIPANGYTPNGKHHEIYLSDPRRTAPDQLKTALRQPVKSVDPDH
ncbi:MAG: GyrI-like domain-containing protein [Anaerolineae bacterium]|nr:GyrI-like domain-containing protein [Anaerolineae bacterium]